MARIKAEAFLDEMVRPSVDDVVINEGATIESASCWVFFYNTRAYLETGWVRHALAGNAPVFVAKNDLGVNFGRTDVSVDEQLSAD